MELKPYCMLLPCCHFPSFNRTAYGIETGLDFTYFIASLLLIAPLMELKPFTYRVT